MTSSAFNPDRGLRLVLRALRYRNYRLFFVGQGISLIGTWMQRLAMSWLIYRLTGSAFLLGFVGFLSMLPSFFVSPFAGVLLDRWSKHRVIVITQVLAMVQALVLAGLLLSGLLTQGNAAWIIIALSTFLGVVGAFDMPARQSFIVEMVEDRSDLGNAIALNSSLFNSARLVGPPIAGVLVAAVGEGWCFLLNGLSYVPVIGALLLMRLPSRPRQAPARHVLQELVEGVRYAVGFVPIRSLLLLIAFNSLMGQPYAVLMPVFSKDVFHGDAQLLGVLMASAGVGALGGAAYLASRRGVLGLGRLIAVATGVFGLGLVGFSQVTSPWLALPLLALVGWGMMVQMASCNTVLQTLVDDDKRGRVMSFYAMTFAGMAPFGSLAAGALGNALGAPQTVLISGLAGLMAAVVFAWYLPRLQRLAAPIYLERGVVPAVVGDLTGEGRVPSPPGEDPDEGI